MLPEPLEALVPWRPPSLMIDRVLSWESGSRLVATKLVTAGEARSARGTFPAVLLVEGVAQCAALLHRLSYGESARDRQPLLGRIRSRWRGAARAGDTLRFEVAAIKMTLDGGLFRGVVHGASDGLARVELAVAVRRDS